MDVGDLSDDGGCTLGIIAFQNCIPAAGKVRSSLTGTDSPTTRCPRGQTLLRLAAVTAAVAAVEGLSPQSPARRSLQLSISDSSAQTLQPAQAIPPDHAMSAGTDPLAVGSGDGGGGGGGSGRGSVPAEPSELLVTIIDIRFSGSNTTARTSYPTRPRHVRGDRPSCGWQR